MAPSAKRYSVENRRGVFPFLKKIIIRKFICLEIIKKRIYTTASSRRLFFSAGKA
jgi:hypothetical protein